MEPNPGGGGGGGGGGNGDPPPELPHHKWISCALELTRLPTVGSRVLYFPQGHFEQWAEHLVAPPDGHGPSILCNVNSVNVVTAAHAPYATISLTPVPDHAPAPDALPNPRPPTNFAYNLKSLTFSDRTTVSGSIPKNIHATVLPPLGDGVQQQELEMVDTKGRTWKFSHKRAGANHCLKNEWREFVIANGATQDDQVFFLRAENGQLLIELRRPANTVQAAADRLAAPPLDLAGEIGQARELSAQGTQFTATFYPHKGLGKFIVPPSEFEKAHGVVWAAGMKVRTRKDVLEHTTKPRLYNVEQLTGTITAVTDSAWRGLEILWADSTTTMVSPWEVVIIGDPPRKKRKIGAAGPSKAVLFGADLAAAAPPLDSGA